MDLNKVFKVFSWRNKSNLVDHELPPFDQNMRRRLIFLIQERINAYQNGNLNLFYEELFKMITLLTGKSPLSKNYTSVNGLSERSSDVLCYLFECSTASFINSLELIFKVKQTMWFFREYRYGEKSSLRNDINEIFEFTDIDYYLTPHVVKEVDSNFFGEKRKASVISEFPKIILKEHKVINEQAIEPALFLLAKEEFESARIEFELSLIDFRKGDYSDSILKACSALESVLKIICHIKRLNYKQEHTLKTLLDIVCDELEIPGYLKTTFQSIGSIRSKKSSAHGKGVRLDQVDRNTAQLSINLTATTIVFLIQSAEL